MNDDWIRSEEKRLFPEFTERPNYFADGYMYSAPSYHFAAGLINEELIEDLKAGSTMLSVGAGKAHLEQFLVKAFGVAPDAITIADVSKAPTSLFASRQFDMHDAWPQLDSFHYVLFPKSVFLREPQKRSTRGSDLVHLLEESYAALVPGGQMRMTGYLPPASELNAVKNILEGTCSSRIRHYSGKLHDFMQMDKI
jgi:hypothetical protein